VEAQERRALHVSAKTLGVIDPCEGWGRRWSESGGSPLEKSPRENQVDRWGHRRYLVSNTSALRHESASIGAPFSTRPGRLPVTDIDF